MMNHLEGEYGIFETIKTIEDFYRENGIDVEELMYMGKGEFGIAYRIDEERVLKQTSSRTEFNIAQKMEKLDIPVLRSFAKIYKTEVINDVSLRANMFIIMENLRESSKIERLWYEMMELLESQGLSVQYLDHLDVDELEEQGYMISEELQNYMNEIEDIVRGLLDPILYIQIYKYIFTLHTYYRNSKYL